MKNISIDLRRLYQNMDNCRRCVDDLACPLEADGEKVSRTVVPKAAMSKIVLVGQALGASTQRLSGLPYTLKSLKLSSTGRNLDRFLNLFGYTIDSHNPACGFQYAYSSDIAQCFPGKRESGKGDRKPSDSEIANCIKQGFLSEELRLIKPNLILLMGKSSRDSFFQHFLRLGYNEFLTEHINEIVDREEVPRFEGMAVIPIQHPSGANPNFRHMLTDEELIRYIKEVID